MSTIIRCHNIKTNTTRYLSGCHYNTESAEVEFEIDTGELSDVTTFISFNVIDQMDLSAFIEGLT